MEHPNPTKLTVDELEADLDANQYTVTQLREARQLEQSRDDPRTTALDAIGDELDERTRGPDQSTDETTNVEQAAEHGGGATEQGVPGIDLPDPYIDDAPETVTVAIPLPMGFAGEMHTEPGAHVRKYTMRVKRSLETPTNTVTLAASDPMHPEHEA